MSNKKKQTYGSKASSSKKKDSKTTAAVTTTSSSSSSPKDAPQETPKGVFTQPQLTAIVFIVMGVSRLLEWKLALKEVTEHTESHVNGTGLCQAYMKTIKAEDDNNETSVDYDFVCNNPVTRLLLQMKYDSSLQIMAMVVYIALQCWNNERLLHRINTCLFMVPISSTLVLLQICMPYLESSKTYNLTMACSILMAVAGPAAVVTLREIFTQGLGRPASTRGTIQSLFLSSMVFLQFYDMYEWWCTAQLGSTNDATTTTTSSSSVLSMTTLTVDNEWTDAWKVFFYNMIMDKLTVSLLLTCVWICFEDYRQRHFLLCWSVLKGVEHQYQMIQYKNEADSFHNWSMREKTVLASCVFATVAWMAPSFGFNAANKKSKTV